jgi:peptidase M28-like protein
MMLVFSTRSTRLAVVAAAALAACARAPRADTSGAVVFDAPRRVAPVVGEAVGVSIGLNRDPALADLLTEVSASRIRTTDSTLVAFGTRHTMSDTLSATRGIGAARRWIHAELSRYSRECGGCLHIEYDPAMVVVERHRQKPRVNVVNVLAWLPGRDTSRVVVLGGHYDSCICNADRFDATSDAPGADDDGSGTAAVIELARLFSRRYPRGLEASILLALYSGEELGLLGSTHLAERLHAQGYRVVAGMTDDIVGNVVADDGRVDSTSVRVYAPGFPLLERDGRMSVNLEMDASPSRELGRYVWGLGAVYLPGFEVRPTFRLDRVGRGGDHAPFFRNGDPALRFTERLENYKRQHLPTDRLADVNFGYAANVARLNAATIGALAAAPPAPDSVGARRDAPSGGQKWNVGWRAVPGATAYEVLVRRTTAATHERVIAVGSATSYLLDEQLDDAWVAVRAVGANGHRSLATVVSSFGFVTR